MFTGLIEGIGEILRVRKSSMKMELTVRLPFTVNTGDSVSIDGVCLTVKEVSSNIARFDVVKETMDRSTLRFLREGKKVNLERALKVDGRFGGHIVLGHVDGIGKIKEIKKEKEETLLIINYPKEIESFIALKGSIAIDGISLTISDVNKMEFFVNIVPYTLENTTLKFKNEGDYVNIEVDVIARYLSRIVEVKNGRGKV